MADYYPLLARAVAALPDSTPEARRAIYDRARKALIGQLQRVEPPVPEADIERETATLAQAAQRLEDEIASKGKVEAPPARTPPAGPTPRPAPAATPEAKPEARPPVQAPARSADAPAAKSPFAIRPPGAERPWATGKPATPPAPPPAPSAPPAAPSAAAPVAPSAPAPQAAPPPVISKPPASSAPPVAAPTPKPDPQPERPTPPLPPSAIPRPAAPAAMVPAIARDRIWPPQRPAAPPPARGGEAASAPPQQTAPQPAQRPPVAPEPATIARRDQHPSMAPDVAHAAHDETSAPSVSLPDDSSGEGSESGLLSKLRVFGRPRAGGEEFSEVLDATERGEFPDRDMRAESIRPIAPQPPPQKESLLRYWIFAAVLLLVVGGIAALAFRLRDNPEDFTRVTRPNPATADPDQTSGKIVERIGGGPGARVDSTPAPAPKPAAPSRPDAGAPAPASVQAPTIDQSVVPVAHRAALLIEAPDDPQRVKTYVGTVLWHIENPPGAPPVLVAELNLGDAQFRATMRIAKNTDPRLPASHTIDLKFTPTPGGPIPGVNEIDLPQMRAEDRPSGEALSGIPAPITTNYFLIGLTAGEVAQARNLDLLSSRTWFDLPLLLSNGKIAKITFEKGTTGQRMLDSVMAVWRSGG